MTVYKTKQRDLILQQITTYHDMPFTADDLLRHFLSSKPRVSKATIYRTLEILEQEGTILKYYLKPQESAFYQYIEHHTNCEAHFHCVCSSCATMFHIDCESFNELFAHFKQDHHFTIDLQRSLLFGICDACEQGVTL